MAAPYSGQTQMHQVVMFTVGSLSGITDVDSDDNAPAEYYTIDGVRVDRPEKGLYIIRQGTKARKVIL